ncbi:neo-calmodulin-like isoform X2 [Liolophura sinensis]|uniref:neo-calmodulin-like isoform X2 n=1 Tax=Liolophura sinensis TaxID=3198878 RepID=UPI003158FBBC
MPRSRSKERKDKEWETEVKDLFHRFDKDRNGVWSKEELGIAMNKLGFTASPTQVAELFKQLDKNKSGKIEYKEFKYFMDKELVKQNDPERQRQMMWEAFEMFDKDRNGYIDSKELKAAMKQLGEPLTDAQCNEMIREADMDGDGRINYIEFVKKWMEVGAVS